MSGKSYRRKDSATGEKGSLEEQTQTTEEQNNRVQTAEPEGEQTTPRQKFIGEYKTFLEARAKEVDALTGDAQVQRIQGLLLQVETVSTQLAAGTIPDIAALSTAPDSSATTSAGRGYVPPELVGVVRPLIAKLEVGVGGATETTQAPVEGSKHSQDDWNSRLGVPQYRTQSDNLAAPEATCNVTSFSMILERLGYSRADVLAAVEKQLKIRYLRGQKKDPNKEDLSKVTLPDDQWQKEIRTYLDTQNAAGKGYQKLRGGATTDKQREELSKEFKDNAQMEDVLDFLLNLLGVSRYGITGSATSVLGKIEPDAGERPGVETISKGGKNTWKSVKESVGGALDAGGSAMLSLFHKGKGQTGTHLIVVQQVTSAGIVVDDPYGKIRATYDRSKAGDAYAEPGKTRGNSGLKNTVNKEDTDEDGFDDDWKVARAQDGTSNETRGGSVTLADNQVDGMWNYVSIYRRAAQPQAQAAK